jgi:uncharacterized OsmC-like protein
MPTSKGKYLGELRTENQHLASEETFITDAPLDNNGKGQAFSPTDAVCAALSSCMMTLMGIYAERENISLEGLNTKVTKHMASNPRRISKIEIDFEWPKPEATDHQKEMLKRTALNCPVAKSLHPEIEQVVSFNF